MPVYLSIAGLVFTFFGAVLASLGAFVSEKRAAELAATKWNGNSELKSALLRQSRMAVAGLGLIAGGTVLQVAATILLMGNGFAR